MELHQRESLHTYLAYNSNSPTKRGASAFGDLPPHTDTQVWTDRQTYRPTRGRGSKRCVRGVEVIKGGAEGRGHLAHGLQDLHFPQHGGDALSEGRLEQEAEDPFGEVGDLGQLEEESVGINTCFL